MDLPAEVEVEVDPRPSKAQVRGFARPALILAAWFGLIGGYLDLLLIVLKKDAFHASMYYNQGRHFAWTVPLANLSILLAVGLAVATLGRLRPGLISLRASAWLFASLALWEPLLRTPLAGVGSLVLVAGLGRWISLPFGSGSPKFWRFANRGLIVLAVLLGLTASASLGWRAIEESRAEARLPAPALGSKNVLLLVLDTVRAESLGLLGYSRDTTPNLARWAKKGVRFDRAIATAPWTLPSHGSMLTGRWPYQLNLHWQGTLDGSVPTLAGYLASKGYRTGGFVSNNNFCSYESGLDRGFVHYEDYPITPTSILGTSVIGRWIVQHGLIRDDYYALKWLLFQSRGAEAIQRAFLDWLPRERGGPRPFFAFLNYLDAHEPFVLPKGPEPHFGTRPGSPSDFAMLMDYWERDKTKLDPKDVELARDAYDDCIAHLDRQLGALLDELDRRGVLRNTVVVLTSDHGEEFGEHGIFNHGYSLYQQAVRVPLVILSTAGEAPEGRVVPGEASLRDVPATVVDLLGLSAGSPFPGTSLANLWRSGDPTSPGLSEVNAPPVLDPRRGRGPGPRGFTMSMMAGGRHLIRDGSGTESLFDLDRDPEESRDLKFSSDAYASMGRLRSSILKTLTAEPAKLGMSVLYLGRYAQALETLLGGPSTAPVGTGPGRVTSGDRANRGAGPDRR